MASGLSLSLHYATLLLLLLLLLLAQTIHSAPIAKPKNLTQHKKPRPLMNTHIVHADPLAKPPRFATHKHWYSYLTAATSSPSATASSSRILYTYDTVVRGFAVRLSADEARRLSSAAGVVGVQQDRVLRLLTTRSPGFLWLDPGFGAWKDTDFGDGVIIGFVDAGIWPESGSFNDTGLGPVRATWRGGCVDAWDFNASLCSNKLVGAKAFHIAADAMAASDRGKGVPSPRDTLGHGTHVSSTAAGSEVHCVGVVEFARGTARGVAPKARIAMYRVSEDTPIADVIAAIDAVVKDGVDIISMSLGYLDRPAFHSDALAIAAFGAERSGELVVLAGGNFGPRASSVINVAPWMITVGAGTVDRMFPASLKLGDGTVLSGQSLYSVKSSGTTIIPLVSSSCLKKDMTPGKIMGKIVVCLAGEGNERLVRAAGGVGLVDADNSTWSRDGLETMEMTFGIPGILLSRSTGEKLKSYMASSMYPVASFHFTCEMAIGENRAPMVASFSSRGPNPVVPELLKPDVVAPGQSILAAWKGEYKMTSGTSMSCPHVAGVAALIKKKHGDWTPAMIRSALITTAGTGTLDNTDREILDSAVIDSHGVTVATPFDVGAGHVRPQLAMDPGLVYNADTQDYIDFLCSLNYTREQLRRFAPDMTTCKKTLPGSLAGLNYPSFVVVFDNRTDIRTLTRTVTMVSEEAETYNVIVVAPEHVKVTVTPMTLEFKKSNEKKSYTVEFRNQAGGILMAGWEFGHIIWENEDHQVRSPVAFHWKN